MRASTFDDEILDVREVAAFLKTTPCALLCQRHRGGGPPFVKVGRKLVIRRSVLLAWLDSLTEQPAGDP